MQILQFYCMKSVGGNMQVSLWKKVVVGLGLGVLCGLVLQEHAIYLKPLGDIFIRLIKMIMVPLILITIINGVTGVGDVKSLRRISVKASCAYIFTTITAITIGLFVASFLQPGGDFRFNTLDPETLSFESTTNFAKLFEALLSVIPDNAIGAMAQGTILQVVFFAFFCGIAINAIPVESRAIIRGAILNTSKVVFKMVEFIMHLAPVAAFCLTAWTIGTQGLDVLKNLAKLVGCTYLAFGIQYVVFGMVILSWTKLSPLPFFRKSFEYQSIAFSTSSSKAALPTTINVCKNKLGISDTSASFVLPLGAAINMDGVAIYMGVCALFFAQAVGKILTFSDYLLIMLTGTLGSMGAAGVPGGTIIMLPLVLSVVGLPLDGVALIVGIDRIVDMMRTTISITGDAAVALCIDHSENLLDKKSYYSNTGMEHVIDKPPLEDVT